MDWRLQNLYNWGNLPLLIVTQEDFWPCLTAVTRSCMIMCPSISHIHNMQHNFSICFQILIRNLASVNTKCASNGVTESRTHCQSAPFTVCLFAITLYIKKTFSARIAYVISVFHNFENQKQQKEIFLIKHFYQIDLLNIHPPFLCQLHGYHWWIILKSKFLLEQHTWKGYGEDCVAVCQFVNKPTQ